MAWILTIPQYQLLFSVQGLQLEGAPWEVVMERTPAARGGESKKTRRYHDEQTFSSLILWAERWDMAQGFFRSKVEQRCHSKSRPFPSSQTLRCLRKGSYHLLILKISPPTIRQIDRLTSIRSALTIPHSHRERINLTIWIWDWILESHRIVVRAWSWIIGIDSPGRYCGIVPDDPNLERWRERGISNGER